MRAIMFVAAALMVTFPAAADSPVSSFSKAKKFLADLHQEIGHMTTIYCGCPYERVNGSNGKPTPSGDITREACGLETRKNDKRSDQVEWEHVVPASWYGNTRACWALKGKAYPECAGKNGRDCCKKVNESFRIAHNDPNNLFPSSGEVNGDRLNHPYGTISGEAREYGSCDFEKAKVSGQTVAEPGDGPLRGTLARAMLYMAEVYGADVRLPMQTVWEWHMQHPPAPWEIERAQLIAERTGFRNNWILGRE